MRNFAIAIDGPAGSGKSTVAKNIAKRLNITYVDTGAMYRAVALYCLNSGIDTTNSKSVVEALDNVHMDIIQSENGQIIILNGEDVSTQVRTPQAGRGASEVAVIQEVRQKLVNMQRSIADGKSVVMDGRDIGTNVLTKAQVKIYLNAGVDERTKRRICELEKLGEKADFQDIKKQIEMRDYNDINREHNPLCKAVDAVEIDTTGMTIEQVVEEIIDIAKIKIE